MRLKFGPVVFVVTCIVAIHGCTCSTWDGCDFSEGEGKDVGGGGIYEGDCSGVPPTGYSGQPTFLSSSFRCQNLSGKAIIGHFFLDAASFKDNGDGVGTESVADGVWDAATNYWNDDDYLSSFVLVSYDPTTDDIDGATHADGDGRNLVKMDPGTYTDNSPSSLIQTLAHTGCYYPTGYPQYGYSECVVTVYSKYYKDGELTQVPWAVDLSADAEHVSHTKTLRPLGTSTPYSSNWALIAAPRQPVRAPGAHRRHWPMSPSPSTPSSRNGSAT